jgi:guanylate kinase
MKQSADVSPPSLLFVISGPSASGKGGALRRLGMRDDINRVTTYTTRAMREIERNGIDYHFVSTERFFELVQEGEIVEFAQPYKDAHYGSPRALYLPSNRHRVVELDPAGYMRARTLAQTRVIGIFIYPGGSEEVRQRLAVRNDTPSAENRVRVVSAQLEQSWWYEYVLFNSDLEEFHATLDLVVNSEITKYAGHRQLADMYFATQQEIA